eukprot:2472-Heterococcus_DN1.PRE.2
MPALFSPASSNATHTNTPNQTRMAVPPQNLSKPLPQNFLLECVSAGAAQREACVCSQQPVVTKLIVYCSMRACVYSSIMHRCLLDVPCGVALYAVQQLDALTSLQQQRATICISMHMHRC